MHRGATMYPVSSSDRTANKEEKLQYEESDKMSVPNFYKVMKGLRHILNALAFDDRIPEDVFTNDDVDTLCNAENILAVLENQNEQIPIINVFLNKNKTTSMDTVLATEERSFSIEESVEHLQRVGWMRDHDEALTKSADLKYDAGYRAGLENAWNFASHLVNISKDVTEIIYMSANGGKGVPVAMEMTYEEAKKIFDDYFERIKRRTEYE